MKGILLKEDRGWIVQQKDTMMFLSLHPDDERALNTYKLDEIEGKEVEFAILRKGVEYGFPNDTRTPVHDMAKLILPTNASERWSKIMDDKNPKQGQTILSKETSENWDDIFYTYQMENYPPHGGPFDDAIPLEDWLKQNYPIPPLKR